MRVALSLMFPTLTIAIAPSALFQVLHRPQQHAHVLGMALLDIAPKVSIE